MVKVFIIKQITKMKKYQVIFADLDGTLIETVSGNTFPEGVWDMRIRFGVLDKIREIHPKCLLIVSNQGGIEKGFVNRRNFDFKMEYLSRSITEYTGIPVEHSYCSSNDPDFKYRKPNIGMANSLLSKMSYRGIIEKDISPSEILMIGDASGKPGQFSDSDKKFAENAGFDYIDVEDFVGTKDNHYGDFTS